METIYCPTCAKIVEKPLTIDDKGYIECSSCMVWFDPKNPSVMRDMWLAERGLPIVYDRDILEGIVTERDVLRRICVDRQEDICVVCGHGMYGDTAVHEAIIKRGDLPGDPRVFNPVNCVALHHTTGCHENTKRVDALCAQYLVKHYGAELVSEYISSLNFRTIPGRARAALGTAGIFTG